MKPVFKLLALFLIFSAMACASSTPNKDTKKVRKTEDPTPTIINKLQKTWDGVKTFQASFKQVVESEEMGTEDSSSGTVYVSKPDKIRWVSDSENTVQILNGKTLTLIQINKRRNSTTVEIIENADQNVDTKILSFLSGKTKLKSAYQFKFVSKTNDVTTLKFIPRKKGSEMFIVEIDNQSYLLRSLRTKNLGSKVHTEFLNTKTNLEIDPTLFVYKPKKTDIVHYQ